MPNDELAALGEQLREARLQREFTLQEVETALRIRARFIEGLEQGQPDPSLSEMQVRGFLRNYAIYLRLDPTEVLQAYEQAKLPKRRRLFGGVKRQTTPLNPTPQRTTTQPIPIVVPDDTNEVSNEENGRSLTRTLLMGGLALILIGMIVVGLYIVFSAVTQTDDSNDTLANPSILEESPEIITSPNGAINNFNPLPTLTPTQGVVLPTIQPDFVGADALNINVTARQRSWLRITVDGVVQFQGVLRPGTGVQYSGQESIRLRTANAGGLEVTINNQPLGTLGSHSQEYDQTFTLDNQPPTPTVVPTLTPFITPTTEGSAQQILPSATQVGIASTAPLANDNPSAPTPLPTLGAYSTATDTPTRTLTPTPITPTVTPTPSSSITATATATIVLPERITRTPRP